MACCERRFEAEHVGDVLVLGLGVSGKSTARYLASLMGTRVDSVFIAAGGFNESSQSFVQELAGDGVTYAFGDDALSGLDRHFDLCIASPGIPCWHQLYVNALALSDELVSEVEFAWRESSPESTWVAITGTNGKTTTTSLAAHVLKECGFAAAAVGNIGDVCLDAVAAGDTQVYVAEVSSYQLYSTRLFAPDIAVMLNITPDHLHWHQTLEAYRDAKFNLLRAMDSDGSYGCLAKAAGVKGPASPIAILDACNDVVRAQVREMKSRGVDYIPLGTAAGMNDDMRARCGSRNAAFIGEGGMLCVAFHGTEHAVLQVDDLQIKGEHNASNALAAAAIAVTLGAQDDEIARALAAFKPLEHRIEPCGTIAGVECYNDSKATNVDATCKALAAFPGRRVAILLGGDDKGTDLSELVSAVHANAGSAVCFGAAGPRFADAFESVADEAPEGFSVERAAHLEDALDVALSNARQGDVILLSPACASFDEFTSFEQRGDVFKQLVAARAGGDAGRQV